MREPERVLRVRSLIAAVLIAALLGFPLVPRSGRADEEAPEEEVQEAEIQDEAPIEEEHWYDGPLYAADVTIDLLVIRPCAVITLAVGSVLFVPAALLTAPNGTDSIGDAWGRFVKEPGEYLWARPLGEL